MVNEPSVFAPLTFYCISVNSVVSASMKCHCVTMLILLIDVVHIQCYCLNSKANCMEQLGVVGTCIEWIGSCICQVFFFFAISNLGVGLFDAVLCTN